VNHSATVSIYYTDSDRDALETQIDNFKTLEEVKEFLDSGSFTENPIGVDFDPEGFISRLEAGESDKARDRRPGSDGIHVHSAEGEPFPLAIRL
jgi:hypothetical protein